MYVVLYPVREFVRLRDEFSGHGGYMSHISVISVCHVNSSHYVTNLAGIADICHTCPSYPVCRVSSSQNVTNLADIADICDICVPYLACRVNSSHYVTNLAEIVDM